MGYFNFYIIKKIINSLFNYIRKNKKFIIIFIIFVCILFIKEKCFATSVSVDPVYDVNAMLVEYEKNQQDMFALFSYYPYSGNTEFWEEGLSIIYNYIGQGYDFYIRRYNNSTTSEYYEIYLYNTSVNDGSVIGPLNYAGLSLVDTNNFNIKQLKFTSSKFMKYKVTWYNTNNTGTVELLNTTETLYVPYDIKDYKSPLLLEYIKLFTSGFQDENYYLNHISNYIDTIEDINADILSFLNTLSSQLSQISTNTNNSQNLSQISNKINDLLTDNDTIINQNAEMIQQQEQINENLEDVNDSVQELKDTITDDTVESGAEDLPTTSVNDPTQSGIDNIFTSIYNAFCVGTAQDIVFPVPFTNKSISLSPYYVRDMLNNNGAGWVYTLIQAFWGYLIGRFIVYDIMKKISKIKSGNIEELETNNIKGDML